MHTPPYAACKTVQLSSRFRDSSKSICLIALQNRSLHHTSIALHLTVGWSADGFECVYSWRLPAWAWGTPTLSTGPPSPLWWFRSATTRASSRAAPTRGTALATSCLVSCCAVCSCNRSSCTRNVCFLAVILCTVLSCVAVCAVDM